ncbi:uncharacterized protein EV420DRAFT_403193 [Desarmillaria tabescens]|uniref:Uncharacterized protein n=1 Tax=Armillaria tabescens TaxID=1929756 RepID=A0AA39KBX8_ARMTA|nr:uncharacterized protein EV420DRAFT_403193 [Desarmillaria tabescens]KAK0457958.1 hypothetical protein EV420DRAFT_403193 [Desarmillaria tabescens]
MALAWSPLQGAELSVAIIVCSHSTLVTVGALICNFVKVLKCCQCIHTTRLYAHMVRFDVASTSATSPTSINLPCLQLLYDTTACWNGTRWTCVRQRKEAA